MSDQREVVDLVDVYVPQSEVRAFIIQKNLRCRKIFCVLGFVLLKQETAGMLPNAAVSK